MSIFNFYLLVFKRLLGPYLWTCTALIIETIANVELQALLAPAESIASKAGVDGEIVVEKTRTCNWQTGYNAMTIRYEGLFSLELQILVGFQGVHFKLQCQLLV